MTEIIREANLPSAKRHSAKKKRALETHDLTPEPAILLHRRTIYFIGNETTMPDHDQNATEM